MRPVACVVCAPRFIFRVEREPIYSLCTFFCRWRGGRGVLKQSRTARDGMVVSMRRGPSALNEALVPAYNVFLSTFTVDRKTLSTNITIQESSSDPFFNHSGITRLTSQTPFIIYVCIRVCINKGCICNVASCRMCLKTSISTWTTATRMSGRLRRFIGTAPGLLSKCIFVLEHAREPVMILRISHLYAHAGVYTVRAIYQHPYTSESVSVITMVSVQEAISGLRIDGPSAVPNVRYHAGTNHRSVHIEFSIQFSRVFMEFLDSIARQYAWQAVRTAGSDIVYNWTASGPGVHKSEVTAEAQVMH